METIHTPGPWSLAIGEHSVLSGGEGGPFLVAKMAMHDPEEGRANARLTAAAPDLLAVAIELQESAAYWSEYDVPLGILDRINTAIAKATGNDA